MHLMRNCKTQNLERITNIQVLGIVLQLGSSVCQKRFGPKVLCPPRITVAFLWVVKVAPTAKLTHATATVLRVCDHGLGFREMS